MESFHKELTTIVKQSAGADMAQILERPLRALRLLLLRLDSRRIYLLCRLRESRSTGRGPYHRGKGLYSGFQLFLTWVISTFQVTFSICIFTTIFYIRRVLSSLNVCWLPQTGY